jgi:microcystin-dependent protein
MSAFKIKLTTAGLAALVDESNIGTAALQITALDLGSSFYEPTADQDSLHTTIKTLNTFGGIAADNGIIHISIRDESSDIYELGEIGLRTGTGVLLGIVSSSDGLITTKGANDVLLVAADLAITDADISNITFGEANFIYQPGTEDKEGIYELATDDEVDAGATNKVIDAAKMQSAITRRSSSQINLDDAAKLATSAAIFKLAQEIFNFAGQVSTFAGKKVPTGWLKANGQTVSRTQYNHLWDYASESQNITNDNVKSAGQFGLGDGSKTFTLPDFRGQHLRFWDDGRGIDNGRVIASEQQDDVKQHGHGASSGSAGGHTPNVSIADGGGHTPSVSIADGGGHTPSVSIADGGEHGHTTESNQISGNTTIKDTDDGGYRVIVGEAYSGGETKSAISTDQEADHSHTATAEAVADHNHTVSVTAVADHNHTVSVTAVADHSHTVTVNDTGIAENRVKNVALMVCIKY